MEEENISPSDACIAVLRDNLFGLELDTRCTQIAAFNLAPWSNAEVVNATAEDYPLDGFDGVWLDPARRDPRRGAKRLRNPADWSPSLDFAFGLSDRLPTGVKLGPGIDRGLIPETCEA